MKSGVAKHQLETPTGSRSRLEQGTIAQASGCSFRRGSSASISLTASVSGRLRQRRGVSSRSLSSATTRPSPIRKANQVRTAEVLRRMVAGLSPMSFCR